MSKIYHKKHEYEVEPWIVWSVRLMLGVIIVSALIIVAMMLPQ